MPVPASGLAIEEKETRRIWSVQGNRAQHLSRFISAVFGEDSPPRRMLSTDNYRLLQLWPHKAYLLSDLQTPPTATAGFEPILTDISFALCELSLSGERVFDFVKPYLSVDLNSSSLRTSHHLRCRFAQYSILLWWDNANDLRILLDRSYAQSFRYFLEHLMQRHDWNHL